MTAAELARYDERVAELAGDPDLVAWLHGGLAADAESTGDAPTV